MLPTSQAGQTLNIQPAPRLPDFSTTPALQALQDAFKEGIINVDDIRAHALGGEKERLASKLTAEESRNSDDRTLIAPLRRQAAAANLNADILIAPKKAASDAATLDANTAITPVQAADTIDAIKARASIRPVETENAITSGGVAGAQLKSLLPEVKLTQAESEADNTGTLTQSRKLFQSLYPGEKLPTKANGTLDYDALSQRAAPYMALQRLYSTDIGKEALKAVGEKQRWDLLYDANGLPKHPAQVLKDAANVPPAMDAKDIGASASAVADIDHSLDDISRARAITQGANSPVGPGFFEGSKPGQLTAHGKALFGGDQQKYKDHLELTRTMAGGILTSIQGLRGLGAIRNTEIEWLEKHQPGLDYPKELWSDWLNKSEDLLRRGRAVKMQTLPPAVAKTAGTSQLPAEPAKPSAPVLITSQEQLDALPVGTPITDKAGNSGFKK